MLVKLTSEHIFIFRRRIEKWLECISAGNAFHLSKVSFLFSHFNNFGGVRYFASGTGRPWGNPIIDVKSNKTKFILNYFSNCLKSYHNKVVMLVLHHTAISNVMVLKIEIG